MRFALILGLFSVVGAVACAPPVRTHGIIEREPLLRASRNRPPAQPTQLTRTAETKLKADSSPPTPPSEKTTRDTEKTTRAAEKNSKDSDACPAGMKLVDGDYCTKLDLECKKSWYDKSNKKTVCEEFEEKSTCVGEKEHKSYCMDE